MESWRESLGKCNLPICFKCELGDGTLYRGLRLRSIPLLGRFPRGLRHDLGTKANAIWISYPASPEACSRDEEGGFGEIPPLS